MPTGELDVLEFCRKFFRCGQKIAVSIYNSKAIPAQVLRVPGG
jgi:hypothetical protein